MGEGIISKRQVSRKIVEIKRFALRAGILDECQNARGHVRVVSRVFLDGTRKKRDYSWSTLALDLRKKTDTYNIVHIDSYY